MQLKSRQECMLQTPNLPTPSGDYRNVWWLCGFLPLYRSVFLGWYEVKLSSTYWQAGRTTYGKWTNTIEKGRTTIGFDEFIFTGCKVGMFPDESTLKIFPLRSIIRLCKSPSFALRWYSSLVVSLCKDRGNLSDDLSDFPDLCWWWWWWLWCVCFCSELHVPLKATFPRTVVLLSRLISRTTIPFCLMKMYQLTEIE